MSTFSFHSFYVVSKPAVRALNARYNSFMDGSASFMLVLADSAFFLALTASIIFGVILGYYSLRLEENRAVAIVTLSVYTIGCILILLFALSTTDIGL